MTTRKRECEQALADFIRRRAKWEYWATLTYREPLPAAVSQQHLKRFLRITARDLYGVHVDFVWGGEQQSRGVPHFHLLIAPRRDEAPGMASNVTARELDSAWRFSHRRAGFTRFANFDAERGAAWYVAKHKDWDMNVACSRRPICRRSRCRVAPSGW